MALEVEKEIEDVRGKILFCKHKKSRINLVEIKKGYARGGHYHNYEQMHFIISGKIEYIEEKIETQKEIHKIINGPAMIIIPANSAHLFIALEDTVFLEAFSEEYNAENYPKFRKIVEEKMKS